MKSDCVAEIEVADPTRITAYVREVTPMVERYGGCDLARTSRMRKLEGVRPASQVSVLLGWSSPAGAEAFCARGCDRLYREHRVPGSTAEML